MTDEEFNKLLRMVELYGILSTQARMNNDTRNIKLLEYQESAN